MAARNEPTESRRSRQSPARNPEARERQMVSLAVDVAEQQMLSGTASAQVITHYLKLGTAHADLEKQKLAADVELAKARVEQIASGSRMEELTAEAIRAFRAYSGQGESEEFDAY